MKKSIVVAVLSGVLAGGILVSAGSIMADSGSNSTETKSSIVRMKFGGMGRHGEMGLGFMGGQEGLTSFLDELVADGTITETKADKISEYITQKTEDMKAKREEMNNMTQEEREAARAENKEERVGILTELVNEEIITQDEADAIQEKQQEKRTAQRAAMMDEQFAKLVQDEIISEEQADKMKDFLQAKADERKAQMDELKDMTDEEREAYFEENKDKFKGLNILDEMVDEGIISQEQSDKLAEEMPMTGHYRRGNCDSLSEQQE